MDFSLAPAAWWPEQPMGICSLSLRPRHQPACLKWLHRQAWDTWPWQLTLLPSPHTPQRLPLQQITRAAAWGWQHQGAVFRWICQDYLSTEAELSYRYHWLRSAVPHTGSDFVVSKSIWWSKAQRDVHSGLFAGVLEEKQPELLSGKPMCCEPVWRKRWGSLGWETGTLVPYKRGSVSGRTHLQGRFYRLPTERCFFFSYEHSGTCLTGRPEEYDSDIL